MQAAVEAADGIPGGTGGLGEPDREIFLRKYYLGQRTKEIARALNLRENTVDQKVGRGLKKLRVWLEGRRQ